MLLILTPGFRPSFSLPTDCQPGLDSLIGRNGGRDETSSRLKSSKVFEKKIIVQISIDNFFQLSNVCFVNFHKFCSNRKMVLSSVICEKIIKSFTSCSFECDVIYRHTHFKFCLQKAEVVVKWRVKLSYLSRCCNLKL